VEHGEKEQVFFFRFSLGTFLILRTLWTLYHYRRHYPHCKEKEREEEWKKKKLKNEETRKERIKYRDAKGNKERNDEKDVNLDMLSVFNATEGD
jgi:hypothetical protein